MSGLGSNAGNSGQEAYDAARAAGASTGRARQMAQRAAEKAGEQVQSGFTYDYNAEQPNAIQSAFSSAVRQLPTPAAYNPVIAMPADYAVPVQESAGNNGKGKKKSSEAQETKAPGTDGNRNGNDSLFNIAMESALPSLFGPIGIPFMPEQALAAEMPEATEATETSADKGSDAKSARSVMTGKDSQDVPEIDLSGLLDDGSGYPGTKRYEGHNVIGRFNQNATEKDAPPKQSRLFRDAVSSIATAADKSREDNVTADDVKEAVDKLGKEASKDGEISPEELEDIAKVSQMQRFLDFYNSDEGKAWASENNLSLDENNPYTDFRFNAPDALWWDLVGGNHKDVWNDIYKYDEAYSGIDWDADDAAEQFAKILNENAILWNEYQKNPGAVKYGLASSDEAYSDFANYGMNNMGFNYMLDDASLGELAKKGYDVKQDQFNNPQYIAAMLALNDLSALDRQERISPLTGEDWTSLMQSIGEKGEYGDVSDSIYKKGEESGRKNKAEYSILNPIFDMYSPVPGMYIPANAVDTILENNPRLGFKEG